MEQPGDLTAVTQLVRGRCFWLRTEFCSTGYTPGLGDLDQALHTAGDLEGSEV